MKQIWKHRLFTWCVTTRVGDLQSIIISFIKLLGKFNSLSATDRMCREFTHISDVPCSTVCRVFNEQVFHNRIQIASKFRSSKMKFYIRGVIVVAAFVSLSFSLEIRSINLLNFQIASINGSDKSCSKIPTAKVHVNNFTFIEEGFPNLSYLVSSRTELLQTTWDGWSQDYWRDCFFSREGEEQQRLLAWLRNVLIEALFSFWSISQRFFPE